MAARPGAKPRFDPSFCEQLVAHMTRGLSFSSFGGVAKVGRSTLYRWVDERPTFRDAKEKGEYASLLWWESIGQSALLGAPIKIGNKEFDGRKVNTAIWIYTMKCRFRAEGWNEDSDGPQDAIAKKKSFTLNYGRKEKA